MENIPIEFLKLRDNAIMPAYATNGAAGADLYISGIERVSDDLVIVKLGFATDIPEGWQASIRPRSNFADKGWIMANSPATIDSDYRGEWMLKFQPIPYMALPSMVSHENSTPNFRVQSDRSMNMYGQSVPTFSVILDGVQNNVPEINLIKKPFPYNIGERVAQVVFEPVTRGVFITVEQLSQTERGAGGFGSTGVR